jgi:hypothetical protein
MARAAIKMSQIVPWLGTGSLAGKLAGVPISFHCERFGVSVVGDRLSYGNGTSASYGMAMPFSGQLIVATLACTALTGTQSFQLCINGTANTSYQLSATGSASTVYDIKDWQATPLLFAAGTMLTWISVAAPTLSTASDVTYFVIFD